MHKIRLGYIAEEPPSDILAWSGLNYFIARALADQGFELVPLYAWKRRIPLTVYAMKVWCKLSASGYYCEGRNPVVLRNYARQMAARIAESRVDAVFSPGTALTAALDVKIPWFVWTDATVPSLFSLYPGYDRWSQRSKKEAFESERTAVHRAKALIYSSRWAADSAVRDLGAAAGKVHVVPFGANLPAPPERDFAMAKATARARDKIVLLFAGVQWHRKGGVKALAVAEALAEIAGVPVELRILGLGEQTDTSRSRARVIWLGRISKDTPEGVRRFENEFAQAHYLLLPTIADCTPIVFAEANAFALPVVTHDVGGVSCQITHDDNGGLFSLKEDPRGIAEWIFSRWSSGEAYLALCNRARRVFEEKLNWGVTGKQVGQIIRSGLGL